MTRQAATLRAPTQRSAITNDPSKLLGVNGTSAEARRYRDLVEDLAAELGGALTASEQAQVRTAAGHQLNAEKFMARLARGDQVNAEEYTRALNAATRALAALRRNRAAQSRPRRGGLPHGSPHPLAAERTP